MDLQERTRQLAAPRLWDSRDSEHKKNNISYILNPIATKFLGGMCKDVKHSVVEGHGHWSNGTMRTCMSNVSSAAARFQGQRAQK
jgi:hypothetical protein